METTLLRSPPNYFLSTIPPENHKIMVDSNRNPIAHLLSFSYRSFGAGHAVVVGVQSASLLELLEPEESK